MDRTLVKTVQENGYHSFDDIFSNNEVERIKDIISQKEHSNPRFRKGKALFAIRHFLEEIPELVPLLFNPKLKELLTSLGESFHLIKAIYFDKPPRSNWIVNWHQDLTISVKEKADLPGFKNWTRKGEAFAVQAPIELLEDIVTLRIHLDTCTKENGALRVVPGSHRKGIIPVHDLHGAQTNEVICEIPKGGILLMKPLILHASRRTENEQNRRVIHLEFSTKELPENLEWRERKFVPRASARTRLNRL